MSVWRQIYLNMTYLRKKDCRSTASAQKGIVTNSILEAIKQARLPAAYVLVSSLINWRCLGDEIFGFLGHDGWI